MILPNSGVAKKNWWLLCHGSIILNGLKNNKFGRMDGWMDNAIVWHSSVLSGDRSTCTYPYVEFIINQ